MLTGGKRASLPWFLTKQHQGNNHLSGFMYKSMWVGSWISGLFQGWGNAELIPQLDTKYFEELPEADKIDFPFDAHVILFAGQIPCRVRQEKYDLI
jgi:hypothetical protein